MRLIVITNPIAVPNEIRIIHDLFEEGLECLHLRKPDYSEAGVAALLVEISPKWRDRISLHQHHQLADEFGIKRLHFSEDKRNAASAGELSLLKMQGYTLSTSIHDSRALATLPDPFDYVFLGPVFDSISKAGYQSILQSDFKLNKYGKTCEVIALGGISPATIEGAAQMNFDGVAALGSIWKAPEQASQAFRALRVLAAGLKSGARNDVSWLHFISNKTPVMSHLQSIRLALEAGCRWVQLRVKDQTEAEVLDLACEARQLCDWYQAKLIINDFPNVAVAAGADGLHLGLADMPVQQARAIVGHKMVIGGTANTFEDILLRIQEGVDYVGLGPFRFTSTKQNLSPILGLEGYQRLTGQMRAAGRTVPVIAIGGILPDDVPALFAAGVHGVAMSSALIHADDPELVFNQIQQHHADHRR